MRILRLVVKGELGVDLSFKQKNILLGGNKTGKSTFVKLLLYSLGTHIENFIPEISKDSLCQQVEIDIECRNKVKYRVIRKLPHSDTVVVIPLNNNEPIEEELEVLSLDEYSDFLLDTEGYKNQTITFGNDKKAGLRYYFLLRAVIADQETNAGAILASLGGSSRDYINSQNNIKKAIIEEIIQKDNYLIQEKRLKIQKLLENKRSLSSKRSTIGEIMSMELEKDSELVKDKEKIAEKLARIREEKDSLSTENLKNVVNLKNLNDASFEQATVKVKNDLEKVRTNLTDLILEETDISSTISGIKKEVTTLKKMIVARQVFTNIPVERCPICLDFLDFSEHEEADKCPYCKKLIEANKIDNILLYKKMLDESLAEATRVHSEIKSDINKLSKQKDRLEQEANTNQLEYFERLKTLRSPVEEVINSIRMRLEQLAKEEASLENMLNLLNYHQAYGEQLSQTEVELKNARRELEELEKLAGQSDKDNVSAWQSLFFYTLKYVFNDIKTAFLDHDYMPVIDDIDAKSLSSASQKVATRLSYMLSLFNLKDIDGTSIKHPGFVLFDSPKDKNLDTDKYERFLELVSQSLTGQIFITGSITEKQSYLDLFKPEDFLQELLEDNKLLQPT